MTHTPGLEDTHARSVSLIGQTLGGKYRITRELGSGGMGAVYEAQHVGVGRRFAVKVLLPEMARQPEMLERFQREAQTAGSLECDNIAAVLDSGSGPDGTPYIVMELLQGEDLGQLLAREGPLPGPRVVSLLIQACRGLEVAHAKGIVHRDLKPENLFVCRRADGSELVKLLDFGIAKLKPQGPDPRITRTGTTMGTPFYMPPEQARGAKELDQRADLYSIGVILYELLCGAKPHPGESYNEILTHILTGEPEPLERRVASVPAGLARVVHRALAKEPSARQQSVVELIAELKPYEVGGFGAVTPRAMNQSTLAPTPAELAVPPRLGAVRLAVVIVAGLIAGGAAVWWLERGSAEATAVPPPPPVVAAPPPQTEPEPKVEPPAAEPTPPPPVKPVRATSPAPKKQSRPEVKIDSANPYQ